MMAMAPAPGMTLAELLSGIVPTDVCPSLRVRRVSADSRQVDGDTLFLALAGARSHGLQWSGQAERQGAVAILYEPAEGVVPPVAGVPTIAVPRLRCHAGALAARCYGEPSRALTMVGMTGTNGKTSCAHMLAQALHRDDDPCGLIGTLGNGFPGVLDAATHTTPEATALQALLADFRDAGARRAVMEVSSHALEQCRVAAVQFAVAVYTNLSRDHLDYHGDMDRYFAAKRRLFDMPSLSAGVINAADARGAQMREALPGAATCLWFGAGARKRAKARNDQWLEAESLEPTADGLRLTLVGAADLTLDLPLLGRFNAENVLAVVGALIALGRTPSQLARDLAQIGPVPGRMERHGGGAHQPLVLVDYAHTPDALAKVLDAAREHCRGQLWCVFGCGGDRDRGKRPLMGEVAARGADHVVLTDDNPRHEVPSDIVAQIRAGVPAGALAKVMHARDEAIRTAILSAAPDDVVVIAGKGHEQWQEVAGKRRPFSDAGQVVKALRERDA